MGLDCTRLGFSDVGRANTATCEGNLVSIIAPFYNEGEVVELFDQAIRSLLDGLPDTRFEVICVDDGSHDDTLQRLVSLTDRDERFSVIELSRNFGKEAALTAGLDAAKGDAVIPIDADLQDPPELIPTLIAAWQRGADVVLAERMDRDLDGFLKRTTATLFYRVHNWLSKVQIPTNVGDCYGVKSHPGKQPLHEAPRAASARPSILFSQYVREHGVAAFRNSHVLGRALHETLLARIDKLGLIEITVVIGTGSLQVGDVRSRLVVAQSVLAGCSLRPNGPAFTLIGRCTRLAGQWLTLTVGRRGSTNPSKSGAETQWHR